MLTAVDESWCDAKQLIVYLCNIDTGRWCWVSHGAAINTVNLSPPLSFDLCSPYSATTSAHVFGLTSWITDTYSWEREWFRQDNAQKIWGLIWEISRKYSVSTGPPHPNQLGRDLLDLWPSWRATRTMTWPNLTPWPSSSPLQLTKCNVLVPTVNWLLRLLWSHYWDFCDSWVIGEAPVYQIVWFFSSDRSSYSDSVLLYIYRYSYFLRFWAFLPIYLWLFLWMASLTFSSLLFDRTRCLRVLATLDRLAPFNEARSEGGKLVQMIISPPSLSEHGQDVGVMINLTIWTLMAHFKVF